MDLRDTGSFIKEMRKAKNLTQVELADRLSVSEKTISKWECGNGFPDTTLMLPLCDELGITANELLSGKKLDDKEYKQKADENIVELKKQLDDKNKFLLNIECVIGYLASIMFFVLVFTASFIEMVTWVRVLLIVVGFIEFLVGMHFALMIEKDAGYYECANCHYKYIPTTKSVYFAPHLGRTRFMTCPKCSKKTWQKKVINSDK